MAKIFVVEDTADLSEAIVSYLEVDGHTVTLFEQINGVLEAVRLGAPDLIILDVMLPDGDGFRLGRQIKKESDTPILFLTARSSESDRITGFELGAEDYVVKPFSMRELVLRVRSIIKRTASIETHRAARWQLIDKNGNVHELLLDNERHVCTEDGIEIHLTATEWKILSFLTEWEGRVVNRRQILGICLDYLTEGSERTVVTHMKNIRTKLACDDWIETVRSFGYRFNGKACS